MKTMQYIMAIHDALQEEMDRDSDVFLIGEDIGHYGGAFKATLGLIDRFGPDRVIDTPLAESSIIAAALGAAMTGLKPVAEIQFADFFGVCLDSVVNQIATMNYSLAGNVPLSLVIRSPYGGGLSMGYQHSQCVESWLMNTPGIRIVMPSTGYDAKGLLKSAIRYSGPVVFLENKGLYRKDKSQIPEEEYLLPIDKAHIKRPGTDISLISYGASVHTVLEVAESLSIEGIDSEVLDLISLKPLDEEAILATVRKTGRVVIVHEARKTGGAGGEVAALIAEKAFGSLRCPILRLGAYDAPVPFSPPLEGCFIPDIVQVKNAIRSIFDDEESRL